MASVARRPRSVPKPCCDVGASAVRQRLERATAGDAVPRQPLLRRNPLSVFDRASIRDGRPGASPAHTAFHQTITLGGRHGKGAAGAGGSGQNSQ